MLEQSKIICEVLGRKLPENVSPTKFNISRMGKICFIKIEDNEGIILEEVGISYKDYSEEDIFPTIYNEILNRLKNFSTIGFPIWETHTEEFEVVIFTKPDICVTFKCSKKRDNLWYEKLENERSDSI